MFKFVGNENGSSFFTGRRKYFCTDILFSYLEHAAIAGIIAKKDYGKLEVSFRNLGSKKLRV